METITSPLESKTDVYVQDASRHAHEKDYLALSIPGMENAQTIETIDVKEMTTVRFRTEFINNNKPCVIKGAVNHWPAIEKWRDKQYWLNTVTDKRVTVARNNGHELSEKTKIGQIKMSFHEAMTRLYDEVDHTFYIQEVLPEASTDIAGFHFLPAPSRSKNYVPNRLLIQRRSFTTWHAHFVDEFLLCQVNGAKRVMLFSPNIPQEMGHVWHFLRQELYLEGQSLDKNLDFKPIVADLAEGDALYIPPYWHHAVHPLHSGINFSVVHCWGSPIHKFGKFSNYFVKQLYGSKLWPVNKYTPVMPFLAMGSLASYTFKKMAGKISDQYI
ncbi:MAG: cupin-like domain-containing protein [Cytophagales bacterium]|nr:cupin-like domain-containing protein [Cytophagales bacterium]MCA6367079.1 cupin-like domain-containing protein [Cytophagales bacterium]MCA6372957.1 cupin-like domain-containing protein [Cytophagales bacterium]MCA6376243.1 cupin-like domain-containing protein [Cytophagales bacterium]MCA6383309.1 cupin-like domain-containing protein [Cytophagales bacterium]